MNGRCAKIALNCRESVVAGSTKFAPHGESDLNSVIVLAARLCFWTRSAAGDDALEVIFPRAFLGLSVGFD